MKNTIAEIVRQKWIAEETQTDTEGKSRSTGQKAYGCYHKTDRSGNHRLLLRAASALISGTQRQTSGS
jgi:hypothetical protein